jgi:glycosyltransferase involved in cell wall biosynthesis
MRRLRILYLSAYWPRSEPLSGGELRALGIGRALQEIGSVQTVVVRPQLENDVPRNELNVAFAVEPKPRLRTGLRGKIEWALNPRLPYPHGCGVDSEFGCRLVRSTNDFDLVWFGNLRTPNMFWNWAWPRSVLDIDDFPSQIESSKMKARFKFPETLLQLARIYSWKRREQLLGDRFTVLTVCSDDDRSYLRQIGCTRPVHVVPNGFERPIASPVRRPAAPPRIGFIGPFSHPPNLDGIRWFAKNCWPLIKREIPNACLRIAGKGSETELKPAGPDIDGLGWVPDLADEIGTWSLMVVPVRLGAGTRVKIAQAFSLKCPVVSTTYGAYGYDTDGSGCHLLLADTPKTFAEACLRIMRDPIQAGKMANQAWEQFLQKWTWSSIAPRVWSAAEECLRLSVGELPAAR